MAVLGFFTGDLAGDLLLESQIRFMIHENTLRGDKTLFIVPDISVKSNK